MHALPREGELLDGRYLVWRYLREGTMGAVAHAVRLAGKRPVAVKFLLAAHLASDEARARFQREARAAAAIESDHVVKVLDAGETARGVPYIVMDYVDGRDMAELLARDGAPGIGVARAADLIVQSLAGLGAAHAAGVIHRDVKLSNCIVARGEGGRERVTIVDFGISKWRAAAEATLTRSLVQLGTPSYMAPEQSRSARDADARSDLFSAGVMLYRLLTGGFPAEIGRASGAAAARELAVERPEIPAGLAAAVGRALAWDPSDRFATAREMADAIAPYAG